MLDALCGGRLDVGVARAFMPYEFDGFGVSMDESRPRFEEGIEALRRLWTEERVTFEGRFHRFRDVTVLPRPTQSPHPPIWVAAVVSPESFVWAGQQGYHMMVVPYLGEHHELAEKLQLYRRAYREHGHEATRGPGMVMMVLHLYVAPTAREAREEARPYMEQYLRNFRASARAWTGRQSGQYKAYSGLEQMLEEITYERVLAETRAIIGDPEAAARQIQYVRDTFGEVHASFQINFGVMEEPRAPVVAEPAPQLENAIDGRLRERAHGRHRREEALVIRHDRLDARLLEHDLAHPDRVRIARPAPRQIPPVARVPGKQPAPKALTISRSRNRRSSLVT